MLAGVLCPGVMAHSLTDLCLQYVGRCSVSSSDERAEDNHAGHSPGLWGHPVGCLVEAQHHCQPEHRYKSMQPTALDRESSS